MPNALPNEIRDNRLVEQQIVVQASASLPQ
jgi:hypothetical protein